MLPWLQTCNSTVTLTHVINVFKSLVCAHKIQEGNGLIMRGKYQEKPEVPPFVIFNRRVVSHWGGHTFDSRTVVGLAGGPEFKASLGYTVTSCQRAQGGKRGEGSGGEK